MRQATKNSVRDNGKTLEIITGIIVASVLGFVSARGTVSGTLSPFGVCVSVVMPGYLMLPCLVSSILSYIIALGSGGAIKYVCALIFACGLKWTFGMIPALRGRVSFSALCASISVFVCGGILLVPNESTTAYMVLLLICESCIAAGCTWFLGSTAKRYGRPSPAIEGMQSDIALALSVSVILLGLGEFEIFSLSLGRVCAMLIILLIAHAGNVGRATVFSVCIGTVLGLGGSSVSITAGLSFGGMLAALFVSTSRIVQPIAFFSSVTALSVIGGDDLTAVTNIFESATAAVIFMLLPCQLLTEIDGMFVVSDCDGQAQFRSFLTGKLRASADTLRSVCDSIGRVDKLMSTSKKKTSGVWETVADEVCRSCPMRLYCFDTAYSATVTAFSEALHILSAEGELTRDNLPKYFVSHCTKQEAIAQKLCSGYKKQLDELTGKKKTAALKSAVCSQLGEMGNMLGELAEEIASIGGSDGQIKSAVTNMLEQRRLMPVAVSAVYNSFSRLCVSFSLAGQAEPDCRELEEEISRICECDMVCSSGGEVFIFTEKSPYTMTAGARSVCHKRESACGDKYSLVSDRSGNSYMILSDGMGSGTAAAVASTLAVSLAAKLLCAGFSPDSTVMLVNTLLIVSSKEENLATLDISKIDLHDGILYTRKCGAAPTYILRHNRLRRIDGESLPLGIRDSIIPDRQKISLEKGDVIIMMSDGAIGENDRLIAEKIKKQTDMNAAAGILCDAAVAAGGENHDDITVICIKIS